MANGKLPGNGGLTVDWFKFFQCDIKTYVLDNLNYAYNNRELSIKQHRGIITLIPKKEITNIIKKTGTQFFS